MAFASSDRADDEAVPMPQLFMANSTSQRQHVLRITTIVLPISAWSIDRQAEYGVAWIKRLNVTGTLCICNPAATNTGVN